MNNFAKIPKHVVVIVALVLMRILYIGFVYSTNSSDEWIAWTETPDSSGYIELADDLEDLQLDKAYYRTPGYAIVISILDKLRFGDLHLKVLFLQQLLDGLVAYFLFLIVARKRKLIALVPSVLYLLHPYSLSFSSLVLPATLAALFVSLTTYLILRWKELSLPQALCIGLLLSTGIMVRPMLLYTPIIISAYFICVNRKTWKKFILPLIVLLISSLVFPLLLRQYNKSHFGMNSISSQGNFEIAARIALLTNYTTQENLFRNGGFKDSLDNLAIDSRENIDFSKRDSIYSNIALRFFKDNPVPVIKSHLLGWIGFLQLSNPQLRYIQLSNNYIGSPLNRGLQLYVLLCSFVIYPGMLLGFIQKKYLNVRYLSLIAILWFIYMGIIHASLCGSYYIVPMLGILLVAGYSGWVIYIETKLQEPNSLLSKIDRRFQKHA